MRFQDALRAAVETRGPGSADALEKSLERLDAKHLERLEPECSRTCREEAVSVLRSKSP